MVVFTPGFGEGCGEKEGRRSGRKWRRREPLTFETCLTLSRSNSRGLLACGSLTRPRQTRECLEHQGELRFTFTGGQSLQ